MIDQSDEQVAEAARRGSHEAFSVLVARYGRRVYSLCHRMTGHRSDAEDLSQDVFVKAYRAVARYEPHRRFAPWLLTIAANACRNHLRGKGPEARSEKVVRDEARGGSSSPASDTPLLASENSSDIRAALESLEPSDRIVLLLRYEEGLTLEETADALAMPRSRAAVRIFRAKARLRDALARRDAEANGGAEARASRPSREPRHHGR